jgi:hypothetical protein
MRIVLGQRKDAGRFVAVTAAVTWEQKDRTDEVYVAVPQEHAQLLHSTPETFVAAALPTAARHREPRLAVDQPLDPTFRAGLEVVQRYHRLWSKHEPVRIEAAAAELPVDTGHLSAVFLSGGVDSMSSLWRNLQLYPLGHPGRITHALHVTLNGPSLAELPSAQLTAHPGLAEVIEQEGITFVPIVTNLRSLDDYEFRADWMWHAHGAVLAGIAHAFTGAFRRVLLASSYDAEHLTPWGSHPLTDHRFSSTSLEFVHDGEELTRLDKLRILTGWPKGLHSLDVCYLWRQRKPGEAPNCGRCEKCQRTLAGLIALGVRTDDISTFRERDLTATSLGRIVTLQDDYERAAWRENLGALEAAERRPEAMAVKSLLRRDAAVVNPGPGRRLLAAAKRCPGKRVLAAAKRRLRG